MPDTSMKRVYERNYITDALFRIDFPTVLELTEDKPPSKYQEKIVENFPRVISRKGGEIKFQVEEELNIKQGKQFPVWDFISKDKTKIISISPEFAFFQSNKYENFEKFYEEIKFTFEPFLSLYPVKIVNRIGLRIINEIKFDSGNPIDWDGFIHKSLNAVPNEFIQQKDKILRSMHSIEIKENDSRLRIQFGLFNPEYPSPVTRKEFILDYDCFMHEDLESGVIFEKVRHFNEIIYKWFELSIRNDLREIMGEIHE